MSNVRETSLAMFHRMRADGTLSRQRLLAYELVAKFGPLTAREADIKNGGARKLLPRSIQPALTWLVESGAITETRQRPCTVTGNQSIEYQCSGSMPSEVRKRPKLSKAEMKAAVDWLRANWDELPRGKSCLNPVGEYFAAKTEQQQPERKNQ